MIIIYIYDPFLNPITQIDNGINKFECKIKLNDVSEASFSMSNTHKDVSYNNFREFNRIKVTECKMGIEKNIIEGVIKKVSSNLLETKILINSDLYLFKKRKIDSDLNFQNVLIEDIVLPILPFGYSLESGIKSKFSKVYKRGISCFDILKDLSLSGYEFIVENKILYFKELIGEDKSRRGENFIDFVFNYKNIRENTISDAKLEYDSDKIINKVTGKNGNIYFTKEDVNSYKRFGKIEEYFTSSGDLESSTKNFLEEHKNSVREFEISPIARDFFVVNVGDIVRVFIDSGNDIMCFNGNLKIVEKKLKIDELPKVTIKLSKTKVKSEDVIDTLKGLKEEMKYIRITN